MAVNSLEVRGNRRTTADTDLGRSNAMWSNCPILSIRENSALGFHRRIQFGNEGFKLSANVNAAVAYWSNGFKLFGSDGFSVTAFDDLGGGITIGSDGDNEGGSLQLQTAPMQISRDTLGLWWEARLRTSSIADTKHGIFAGLAALATLSATVPIAADGTLADINLVGFHRLEGDGDALNTVYKADGVTAVTVEEDAATIAADTWFKVGMYYDPGINPETQDPNRAGLPKYNLSFYFNGRRTATVKQIPSAAGTDFPNDVRLAPIIAVLNATATTPGTTSIDWIEWAQLRSREIPY